MSIDSTERRKQILAAAERLLEHYGVAKTTVKDIAREAAIGVGTVYLEFGSKDDIIKLLASKRHQSILERLHEAVDGESSAADKLQALMNERANVFVGYASAGSHAQELVHCRCQPVELSWAAYVKAEHALVEDVIRAGTESGEFDVADPKLAARTVLCAYMIFTPPWVFGLRAPVLRETLDAMHELVLHGLVTAP